MPTEEDETSVFIDAGFHPAMLEDRWKRYQLLGGRAVTVIACVCVDVDRHTWLRVRLCHRGTERCFGECSFRIDVNLRASLEGLETTLATIGQINLSALGVDPC